MKVVDLDNLWHDISVVPEFPCKILYRHPNGNIFLYRFDERGRNVDGIGTYRTTFDDGMWIDLKNLEPNKQ
jgi:hypothetical protein